MKRSTQVPASLIVALAASFAGHGCSSRRYYNECVDATGRVIPDTSCRTGVPGAHWVQRSVRTGGFGSSGSVGSGGFFGG